MLNCLSVPGVCIWYSMLVLAYMCMWCKSTDKTSSLPSFMDHVLANQKLLTAWPSLNAFPNLHRLNQNHLIENKRQIRHSYAARWLAFWWYYTSPAQTTLQEWKLKKTVATKLPTSLWQDKTLHAPACLKLFGLTKLCKSFIEWRSLWW